MEFVVGVITYGLSYKYMGNKNIWKILVFGCYNIALISLWLFFNDIFEVGYCTKKTVQMLIIDGSSECLFA